MTTEEYAVKIEEKRPAIIRSLLRFVTRATAEDILQDSVLHVLNGAYNRVVPNVSPEFTWASAYWRARTTRARRKACLPVGDRQGGEDCQNEELADLLPHLTARQTRVLYLLYMGYSERGVACLIGFSQPTVHNDRNAIKRAYREMTDG